MSPASRSTIALMGPGLLTARKVADERIVGVDLRLFGEEAKNVLYDDRTLPK